MAHTRLVEELARGYGCPRCRAGEGEPCRYPRGGAVRQAHAVRVNLMVAGELFGG